MTTTSATAAQYLRMSTDQQDLSLDIQRQAISTFAERNGIKVIASYEDPGRSGLTVARRPAMERLLRDVAAQNCPFTLVLVLDVSRWGRFQDVDASAYYEYHCRLHGVDVVYVQEPFGRERTPMSVLLKSLKRTMAAEYSRELSSKIQAGHDRTMELGFQMGDMPSFGLRRLAISKDGRTRALERGDRKGAQSERIRWVPGPTEEIELVRRTFEQFGRTDITLAGLERQLLGEGARLRDGRPITFRMLRTVLTCEAFIGNFVWGRKALRNVRLAGERATTVRRKEGVLAPIVEQRVWDLVQAKLRRTPMPIRRNRSRLLDELRSAYSRNPRMATLDLPEYGCASATVYAREFGSIYDALKLAGVDAGQVHDLRTAASSRSHRLARKLTSDLNDLLVEAGIASSLLPFPLQGVLVENKRIRVQSIWPRMRDGRMRWWYPRTGRSPQDFVLLARFNEDGTAFDLLLLTRNASDAFPLWTDAVPPSIDLLRMQSASEVVATFRHLLSKHLAST